MHPETGDYGCVSLTDIAALACSWIDQDVDDGQRPATKFKMSEVPRIKRGNLNVLLRRKSSGHNSPEVTPVGNTGSVNRRLEELSTRKNPYLRLPEYARGGYTGRMEETEVFGEWWGGPSDEMGPLWGDEVHELLNLAVSGVVECFKKTWGRTPTYPELQNGLQMALECYVPDTSDDGTICRFCRNLITRTPEADERIKRASREERSMNQVEEAWTAEHSMTCNGNGRPYQWHEPLL